jgi:hypothetical protein
MDLATPFPIGNGVAFCRKNNIFFIYLNPNFSILSFSLVDKSFNHLAKALLSLFCKFLKTNSNAFLWLIASRIFL